MTQNQPHAAHPVLLHPGNGDVDYSGTNFLSGIDRMLAEFEAEEHHAVAATGADARGALDLSTHALRGKLSHWWIAHAGDRKRVLDPAGIVGALVRNENGSTSPITAFDRSCHRVLTRSGSVYELGMPETSYAAQARLMLRALGF